MGRRPKMSERVREALDVIAHLRDQGQRDGTWPTGDALAAVGPDVDMDGYLRMAISRLDAGLPLNDRHRAALQWAGAEICPGSPTSEPPFGRPPAPTHGGQASNQAATAGKVGLDPGHTLTNQQGEQNAHR